MRVILAAALLLAVARAAAADGLSAACLDACAAPAEAPFPACPRCEPFNVCSDLYHTDRSAYDGCMARVGACHRESSACGEALQAAARARGGCARAPDPRACCARACTGDLRPPGETSGRWIYVDVIAAGGVRHLPGDTWGIGQVGLLVEALLGSSTYRGDDLPLRAGPFVSAALIFAEERGVGGQLAAGLTLMPYARMHGSTHLPLTLLLSAGALYDLTQGAPDRWGALGRVSLGATSIGQRAWKPLSAWLYVEGQGIAGGRLQVVLGLRLAPTSLITVLMPDHGDP